MDLNTLIFFYYVSITIFHVSSGTNNILRDGLGNALEIIACIQ